MAQQPRQKIRITANLQQTAWFFTGLNYRVGLMISLRHPDRAIPGAGDQSQMLIDGSEEAPGIALLDAPQPITEIRRPLGILTQADKLSQLDIAPLRVTKMPAAHTQLYLSACLFPSETAIAGPVSPQDAHRYSSLVSILNTGSKHATHDALTATLRSGANAAHAHPRHIVSGHSQCETAKGGHTDDTSA